MNFRVVRITNNIEDYQDCEEDTKEFPELVKYVEDEMNTFIIEEDTEEFYKAEEFFFMTSFKRFKITEI